MRKKNLFIAGMIVRCTYLWVKVAKGVVCAFAYSLDGKKYTIVGEPFTARQGK